MRCLSFIYLMMGQKYVFFLLFFHTADIVYFSPFFTALAIERWVVVRRLRSRCFLGGNGFQHPSIADSCISFSSPFSSVPLSLFCVYNPIPLLTPSTSALPSPLFHFLSPVSAKSEKQDIFFRGRIRCQREWRRLRKGHESIKERGMEVEAKEEERERGRCRDGRR